MNILFICSSNKDRSPALEQYFREKYPEHEYRSAGINNYFTSRHGTHYLTAEDIKWAELMVYAEDIHHTVTQNNFRMYVCMKAFVVLNLGEYKQGNVGEDYLLKAEELIDLKAYQI